MAKSFIQPGKNINFVGGATIKSGDVIVAGSLVGVAANDSEAGEVNVMTIDGVWRLPKTGGQTADLGDPAYWDGAGKLVTTANTGSFMGFFADAAAGADVLCDVLLARPGV